MHKRLRFLPLLGAYLLLFQLPMQGEISLSLTAESAILMNADTGKVLYQKNAHKKLYPASITKIATGSYILEHHPEILEQVLTAEQDSIGSVTEEAKIRSRYKLPSHWLVTDSSHIGIKRGEKMRGEDLMYGMMLASGDDASNVLAQGVSGSVPEFMKILNAYLAEIGLKETYFNNPHGLHHPEHVTTAYDMALLGSHALKVPRFEEIVSTVRYTRPKTNMQEPTTLLQTNKLLRKGESYYSKAIGIKTGWHSKAGSTLVAAARDKDRTLVAVVMNVKDRKDLFKETIKLFEAAFSQPKMQKTVLRAGPQKYLYTPPGSKSSVATFAAKDLAISFYPAEEPKVRAFINWKNVSAPLKKGDQLGTLQLKDETGLALAEAPLFAATDLKDGFGQAFKDYMAERPATTAVVLIGFALLAFVFILRKVRR